MSRWCGQEVTYMAWLGSAWCPGGLTKAKPFFTSPEATFSANSITQPAAWGGGKQ